MTDKQIFKARFKDLKEALRGMKAYGHTDYDCMRLLAVQLDGFTHRVIFDFGKNTKIHSLSYCGYMALYPVWDLTDALRTFFEGYGHLCYKHNAKEIVYISPERR